MGTRQELAEQLIALKLKHKSLEAEAADVWQQYEGVQAELVTKMQDEDVQNFKNDDGVTISLVNDMSVKTLDQDALFAWLADTGNDACIKRSIHASTLKSLIKGELEEKGVSEVPGTEL